MRLASIADPNSPTRYLHSSVQRIILTACSDRVSWQADWGVPRLYGCGALCMGLMVLMVWGYVRKFGVEASSAKDKKKVRHLQNLPREPQNKPR